MSDVLEKEIDRLMKSKDDLLMEIRKRECYISRLRSEFKDCVNELCLHCGSYHEEHLGTCNDCRWLKPRHSGGYLDEPGGDDQ